MWALSPSDRSDLIEIAWQAAWLLPLGIALTLLLIRHYSRDLREPSQPPAALDSDAYRARLRKVVRRAQACWTGYLLLAIESAHNLYRLASADGDPGFIATYSFPVYFVLMIAWFPFWSYILNRWVRHFGVERCPCCYNRLWANPLGGLLATVVQQRCPTCRAPVLSPTEPRP